MGRQSDRRARRWQRGLKSFLNRRWCREWLAGLGAISALLPVCVRAEDPKVDAEFLEYLGGMETSTTNWTDVAVVKPTTQSAKEKPVDPPPAEASTSAPSSDVASRSNSAPARPDKS
jgi:hypothetical protein